MTTRSVRRGARAVDFSGEFERSQLVVGDHNTVHRYEGTVVQVLPQGTTPAPSAAPRPQKRLPRPADPPLGRDGELGAARQALTDSAPAEFHGVPGIGKTALLRHLAHHPGTSWPDGIVHARVADQPLEDVVQWLFELFWRTEPLWTPGPLRVREYLRELRVLVVLDDVGLTADEVAALLDAAEQSTFVLAGTEPHLDPTARSVVLRGLPDDAAVAAFERSLGRPLADGERGRVAELARRLDGVPALVLEAARLIRDGVCGLAELAEHPAEELARRRGLALTDAQRQLLALLADLAPAAVPAEHVAAAGDAVSTGDAEALERAGLVEAGSRRYALARPLPAGVREGLPAVEPDALLKRLADAAREGAFVDDAAAAVVAALEWAWRGRALDAVVEGARALDGALLGARRTGAWGVAIARGAAASQELGRAADEAYFLHQQGTRWLCLGEPDRAEEYLLGALALRERLGDQAGVAASRHNLDVLSGAAAGGWPGGGGAGGAGGLERLPRRLRPWALGALSAIAGVALGVAVGSGDGAAPSPTVTETGKTVNAAGKTVNAAGKTVNAAGKTVNGPGETVNAAGKTVNGPGETVTETGKTVTAPGETVTEPGDTVTVTETTTVTGTQPIK